MNILLTDLSASGPEPALPSPGGRTAQLAAGDEQGGKEFALLLHREIAADSEDSVQVFDFAGLLLPETGIEGSESAVLDGIPVAGQLTADATAAIAPERITVPPLELTGRLDEAWSLSGATLPPGGISLPPSAPSALPGGLAAGPDAAVTTLPRGSGGGRNAPEAVVVSLPPAADAGQFGGTISAGAASVTQQPLAGALPDAGVDSLLPPADADGAGVRLPAGAAAAEAMPPPRLEMAAVEAAALRPVDSVSPALAPLSEMRQAAGPSPADVLTLPPGAGAREWGDAVGERINWMINREQSTATLRLDPPALGKLDVQLRITDEATTITIQTQHAQARDLLDAAAPRLRELLLDNGFHNVNVDVSQRQDRQQADGGWSGAAEDDAESGAGSPGAGEPSAGPVRSGDRLLDTFA